MIGEGKVFEKWSVLHRPKICQSCEHALAFLSFWKWQQRHFIEGPPPSRLREPMAQVPVKPGIHSALSRAARAFGI